jgi:hypothetical protein
MHKAILRTSIYICGMLILLCIISSTYVLIASEIPGLDVKICNPSGEVYRSIQISRYSVGAMVVETLKRHELPMPLDYGIAGVGLNLLTVDMLLSISALCTYGNFSTNVDIERISSYMQTNHTDFCEMIVKYASQLPSDCAVRHAPTWQS